MRRYFYLFAASGLFFLNLGCRRDDQIVTYRVSKDSGPAMPMAAMEGQSTAPMMDSAEAPMMDASPAASPKEVTWTVPAGWKEQPPSSMRVGSFLVTGANGQSADISVVPLSGMAGGDLANINRWRGQINLDPIADGDLPQNSQTITPSGHKMLLIDFVSRDLLLENKFKKRLIAAIYTHGDRSWFFKMLGEDRTVAETKPAFLKFLQSLRFHENS